MEGSGIPNLWKIINTNDSSHTHGLSLALHSVLCLQDSLRLADRRGEKPTRASFGSTLGKGQGHRARGWHPGEGAAAHHDANVPMSPSARHQGGDRLCLSKVPACVLGATSVCPEINRRAGGHGFPGRGDRVPPASARVPSLALITDLEQPSSVTLPEGNPCPLSDGVGLSRPSESALRRMGSHQVHIGCGSQSYECPWRIRQRTRNHDLRSRTAPGCGGGWGQQRVHGRASLVSEA